MTTFSSLGGHGAPVGTLHIGQRLLNHNISHQVGDSSEWNHRTTSAVGLGTIIIDNRREVPGTPQPEPAALEAPGYPPKTNRG
jgi:hypothetical protein